jgi:hypothetical protein
MPWTTNSPAYPGDHGFLENNFRFLDAHAEWFADFPNATLYAVLSNTIVPNPNDPAVTIIAPVASRLVEATNVQNVVFDHLNFGFANFPLPPTGYRSQNAGLAWRYDLTCPGVTSELGDGNLIIRGAIRFRSSNNCTVSYCRIAHMGATGVEMFGDNDTVRGNEIFDLGGSGIIIADGLGFTPTCGAQVIDNKVTQFGRAYWDAFGIWAPSCRDALLQGNEVAIGRGTGLSVGSQRGQTGAGHACTCAGNAGFIGHDSILRNKVHHVGLRMGDVAGIYAIDEQSGRCWGNPGDPLSVMHDNFVYCITRDPLLCTAGAVGGIGFDNFSAGWDVGNNVIETDEIPMSFSTFQTVDPDPAAGLWAWGNCGSGTAPNYVDQDLSFLTLMHPPLTQAAYNAVAASFCTYSHVADRCSGGPDPIRPAGAAAIVAAAGPSPNMNYPFQLPPDPQIDP